jgi:hypothetical protein
MNDAQIKHMVDRFLRWKLPKHFHPDGGISFEPIAGKDGPHPFEREPMGTNLFDATQAEAMVRHMVGGLPGTLETYLTMNYDRDVIDHTLRCVKGPNGEVEFYIHPADVSGDTLDFRVTGNILTPKS